MTARLLMIVNVSEMILQLLFLLQIIKHKKGNNSAKILELLWHAYISKLVKARFGIL